MSLGGGSLENQDFKARVDKLAAKADADRAAREAGYMSFFGRLRERLRPRRQAPRVQDGSYGTFGDPGH
jgi:hypothetical protein